MCGIAGIAGQNVEASRPGVERMCARLVWRGPDEGDLVTCDNVALGHRRLRILDLTAAGRQPMTSPDGDVLLVYNGEIYNFRRLRQDLEALGHRFCGTGDTEVVLHCYLEYGPAFLGRLAGMFALALYDRRRRQLLLARDALGIKPLYVWQRGGVLAFASEVRALMASGLPSRQLDGVALAQTLMLEAPLDGRSPWARVRCLGPGECLTWQEGRTECSRFWRFPGAERKLLAPAEVAATVRQVVGEHLVSDVPLGLLLSGGVDSSALAALAMEASPGRLRTFTLAFPGSPLDESGYAEAVARRLGTEHSSIPVTADDILRDVDGFLGSSDFPSADGLNLYTVCKHVRRAGVIVLLSGQGGDEAFAGYATFRQLPRLERMLRWWRRLPRPLRQLGRLATWGSGHFGPRAKFAALLEGTRNRTESYLVLRALMTPRLLRTLLAPPLLGALQQSLCPVVERFESEDGVQDEVAATAKLETEIYLHDTLLRVADVYSMAHSLELRVPFADQRVCEAANRVPPAQRLHDSVPKPVLLNLVRDRLPESCWRRSKGCFHLPVGRWLLGPLRDRAEAVFQGRALADEALFRPRGWRELWQRLEARPDSVAVGHAVWVGFVLGEWLGIHAAQATLALT